MKTKKIKTFIIALFIVCPFITFGQKSETGYDKDLAPVRGNYKTFESLSPKPKSPDLAIDKLKFPFDQAWADKVLSVKPFYLTTVSVNDFKLPDPPANSSDQAKPELNYLLTLQHNRTMA